MRLRVTAHLIGGPLNTADVEMRVVHLDDVPLNLYRGAGAYVLSDGAPVADAGRLIYRWVPDDSPTISGGDPT